MIDKWREPHGSEAGKIGIKSDYVEDVDRLMTDLGADDSDRLQSLNRLTTGDLCRLAEFLDKVLVERRLTKAELEGRAILRTPAEHTHNPS